MNALGFHILAEFYGCNKTCLDDIAEIEAFMVAAAVKAGAEVREVVFHKFSPQGVSGVVIISESHLTIHTWPELNYAAVDIFTCGKRVDPWIACAYLGEKLQAGKTYTIEVGRGGTLTEKIGQKIS